MIKLYFLLFMLIVIKLRICSHIVYQKKVYIYIQMLSDLDCLL